MLLLHAASNWHHKKWMEPRRLSWASAHTIYWGVGGLYLDVSMSVTVFHPLGAIPTITFKISLHFSMRLFMLIPPFIRFWKRQLFQFQLKVSKGREEGFDWVFFVTPLLTKLSILFGGGWLIAILEVQSLCDCVREREKNIYIYMRLCLCCEAEATMHDSGPVHGLSGWLQAAGPAGGDERPAPGE